jgi:flagellar basal-body rod protein FlgB
MKAALDNLLNFHQTALRMRAQRQQLIASNIANADTPNFKARDIEFSRSLQGALSRQVPGTGDLERTSNGHLSSDSRTEPASSSALYRNVQQGSVDGNTVDMDVERNQFADNAIRYEASLTVITAQIKSLLAAIQG